MCVYIKDLTTPDQIRRYSTLKISISAQSPLAVHVLGAQSSFKRDFRLLVTILFFC